MHSMLETYWFYFEFCIQTVNAFNLSEFEDEIRIKSEDDHNTLRDLTYSDD